MPNILGEPQASYFIGYMADALWKRKVLREEHLLGHGPSALYNTVTCALVNWLDRQDVLCDNDTYRVVWTDDLNKIPGLIGPGHQYWNVKEAEKPPLGGFSVRINNEPELYTVGFPLWELNNICAGAGTAVWSVLTYAVDHLLAGMTPHWAMYLAEEWNDSVDEQCDDGAESEDWWPSRATFERDLPHFVFSPLSLKGPKVKRMLERALEELPFGYDKWAIEWSLELLGALRKRKTFENQVWQYAEEQQMPGAAVAWKVNGDPTLRVMDEHIDLLRQTGEFEMNVFVTPFSIPPPGTRDKSLDLALDYIEIAVESLGHVVRLLTTLDSQKDAPRRQQRVRIQDRTLLDVLGREPGPETNVPFIDRF